MSIRDALEKLEDLYRITGKDWELRIHHSLTEPTCPTVVIAPEGSNSTRYRVDRDSIEDGVKAAAEMVYQEVVLGKRIESECPFTNPDDHSEGEG